MVSGQRQATPWAGDAHGQKALNGRYKRSIPHVPFIKRKDDGDSRIWLSCPFRAATLLCSGPQGVKGDCFRSVPTVRMGNRRLWFLVKKRALRAALAVENRLVQCAHHVRRLPPGRIAFVILRTDDSPPVALHPASRRCGEPAQRWRSLSRVTKVAWPPSRLLSGCPGLSAPESVLDRKGVSAVQACALRPVTEGNCVGPGSRKDETTRQSFAWWVKDSSSGREHFRRPADRGVPANAS